jgi:hypothetical protein
LFNYAISDTFTLVTVDVKPGETPNGINMRLDTLIPVAVISTKDFDATTIDPTSIRFGPAKAVEVHGQSHSEDVNRDGRLDSVFHFSSGATGFICSDKSGIIAGKAFTGIAVLGSDSIVVTGCK